MIIVRSPLRISLGGGGTDLPSYYRNHEGFLISAAIDKYVYITCQQTFRDDCLLRYSSIEQVKAGELIQHSIIRETFALMGIEPRFIEITSMADIPAGTGLGSSGSFTTALLKALHEFQHKFIHPHELAEMACHVEIEMLKEPIGKQDQYIAAYGGVTAFTFGKDDKVTAQPLELSDNVRHDLEMNLLLFFTGYSRSASAVLKDQDQRTKADDSSMIDNLHRVKNLGRSSCEALVGGNLRAFGEIMHEHWEYKRKRSTGMSSSHIDETYDIARQSGAIGGKLVGAGGGGFLLFYTEEPVRLRAAMKDRGLTEIRYRFDTQGTKVLNP